MSTISDVAKHAGVSKTTVSRYLNGQYDQMSASTRMRISAAIEELEYRPNLLAASLKTKRTFTLGAVVSNISNPFFASVLQTIENHAAQSGYSVILSSTGDDPRKEARYVQVLRDRQVDGLIVATSGTENRVYADLFRQQFPIVLIDRRIPDAPYDLIALDNREGVRQAVRYLHGLGHRRIAILTGRPVELTSRRERVDAYAACLTELGIEHHPAWVLAESPTEGGGYRAAERLIGLTPRPSALLSTINVMTLGVLKAFRAFGQRVPEALSLIGFDDVEWMSVADPPITTVAQPVQELGEQAVARLVSMIESGSPTEGRIVRLRPRLVVRASCAQLQVAHDGGHPEVPTVR